MQLVFVYCEMTWRHTVNRWSFTCSAAPWRGGGPAGESRTPDTVGPVLGADPAWLYLSFSADKPWWIPSLRADGPTWNEQHVKRRSSSSRAKTERQLQLMLRTIVLPVKFWSSEMTDGPRLGGDSWTGWGAASCWVFEDTYCWCNRWVTVIQQRHQHQFAGQ